MPIQLTVAMDVGDIDSATHDHVRISRQTHDTNRKFISLNLEYGTITGGNFVSGGAMPADGSLFPVGAHISDTEYDTLVTHVTNASELTYDAVKRGLYEWLQANHASLAGTIV